MIRCTLLTLLFLAASSCLDARRIFPKTILEFVQEYPLTKHIQCTRNYAFSYEPFPLYQEYAHNYFPNKGYHTDISIIEVPNGIAYIDSGSHVFVNDTFIKETQVKLLEPFQGRDFIERDDLASVFKVSGRVAVINHLYSYNYGLFILEMLTQLALLELYGVEFDYLWIPHGADWIQELLDIWGIDRAKIIPVYINHALQADTIILPTSVTQNDVLVFNTNYHPDFLIKYVREKILQGMKKREISIELPEKIFISRKDARRFAPNEDEIFALFEPLGYRRYELIYLTPTQKIALFMNAKKIISFMGSGSANIVFANPEAHYFEIMHEVVEASYCYICRTLGINYSCINATTFEDLLHGQVWNIGREIPLDLFKKYIHENVLDL